MPKDVSEESSFDVQEAEDGLRLDKVISARYQELSRARFQTLISGGQVFINGEEVLSPSKKVRIGDNIAFSVPEAVAAAPEPEKILFDVVYEDDDLLVLNKPAGIVVHPGAGHSNGTLVNALLYHCGDSLSGIGGVKRPGIVHRLDKDTSGLMLVAKNDKAHQGLADQLQDRSLSRIYQALVFRVPMPIVGKIDQPIGRHRQNRLKMTVTHSNSKQACTHYRVIESYADIASLVECKLESGRTHQIRVHMDFLKHPLIGDPLYGPQETALLSALKKSGREVSDIKEIKDFPRQALHAREISFTHPATQKHHHYQIGLPDDFSKLLKIFRKEK